MTALSTIYDLFLRWGYLEDDEMVRKVVEWIEEEE